MRNLHEREIPTAATEVGALLDRLAGEDDPWWPAPAWMPLRLDRGLAVGSDGGHGPVHYHVEEHVPGERVRFRFAASTGLDGWHELAVAPGDAASCTLRHEISARPRGPMVLLWPLAVRWMHDALIEDLLDNAEHLASGRLGRRARWSPWVRLLRRSFEWPVRAVDLPEGALLLREVASGEQWLLADAWQVPRPEHVTREPSAWHRAIFRSMPVWVAGALVVRNLLVPVLGIPQGDRSSFDVAATSEDEVLVSTSESHLDFHASVHVDHAGVTLATLARPHTTAGRAYLAVVRRVHPLVIRAMLRRAVADLSEQAPTAAERELAATHAD